MDAQLGNCTQETNRTGIESPENLTPKQRAGGAKNQFFNNVEVTKERGVSKV